MLSGLEEFIFSEMVEFAALFLLSIFNSYGIIIVEMRDGSSSYMKLFLYFSCVVSRIQRIQKKEGCFI